MRKKDILSVIDSLEKVNNSIARNHENHIPVTTEVLIDCQNSAIAVGNEIEKCGQEGEEIVHLLEAYCENIYRMSCMTTDYNACRKLTKKIQKQLIQVRNMIKYDLPDSRKQIVFLPYKASMWDSLESVWKAADSDPECDAYVIPIPYYDKNPDGSFKEMHYEGDEYPDYVPITDYNAYNLEEQHPDMIFIHNPYDEFNHVTSVHPLYYSKNLKQYTDMLVYIPYFILGDIDPTDQDKVKSMEHFCVLPAVFHADYVIVQSENMRQAYIKAMTEALGKETRAVWERKILGLGSPKYDKVVNTNRADLEMPEEWRRVIEKPNGNRKRVVFYNTGVAALLKYEEKMLRKMRSVFQIFKAEQDDIVLLWRPHPLIKATIESMRPALWAEYEKLLREYREEGWGIYDDSADLDRAIALSDVYYGDPSSVVELFEKVGKQIIIQDVALTDSARSIVKSKAITYIDGEYWYVALNDNTLYRMDGDSFTAFSVGVIDEQKGVDLFIDVVSYAGKLFFIPGLAQYIHVYDRCKQKLYKIQFQDNDELSHPKPGSKFSSCIVLENYLYLIPRYYHSMVIVDMDTDVIEYYRIASEQEDKRISIGKAAFMGGDIFIACHNENHVLKYNCKLKKADKIVPGKEEREYLHLFNVDDRIWMIPFDVRDGIRVWNVQTDQFEEILYLPEEIIVQSEECEMAQFPPDVADKIRNKEMSFWGYGAVFGQDIYVFSHFAGRNLVVHTERKEYELWDVKVDCSPDDMFKWGWAIKFIQFVRKEDELYLIGGVSREWFLWKDNMWEKVFVLDGRRIVGKTATEIREGNSAGDVIYNGVKKLLGY